MPVKHLIGIVAAATLLTCDLAEARKGGFVSALIRGGAHAAGSASQSSGSSTGTSTSTGTKTYGADTLTLAQLERCVGVAVELDQSSDTVDARAKTVETERSAVETVQSDLTAAQAKVDRRSKSSVDAFNRKLDALNARIEAHNVAVRAYKALEAGHNQKVTSYNADCARKYYADDMNAVKQKLGLKE
jgi:hypothetical protein